MTVQFLGHSSLLLTIGQIHVLVDPFISGNPKASHINLSTLKADYILLTHAHIDHAGAAGQLSEDKHLPIIGPHEGDQFWIDGLADQSRMFQFPEAKTFVPTRWLHQGDQVTVGHQTLDVLHCPGHTPGHVVFHHQDQGLLFVGDVLFQGSIGRTDFPQGDHDTLIDAIKSKLLVLQDAVRFVPGHGPMSTIGAERRTNPYLQG